jgi:hypothetical protein
MRFVSVMTIECQASQMTLRSRDLLVCQRTQTINAMRFVDFARYLDGHRSKSGLFVLLRFGQ